MGAAYYRGSLLRWRGLLGERCMKGMLFAAMRVVVGLCLQIVGLFCALRFLPMSDEFDQQGFGSMVLFFCIVGITGAVCGLAARRYLLLPALLLFWALWAVFISLDQWSEIKLGQETYMDGVAARLLQIVISSAALAGGIVLGYRWARQLWPAARVDIQARAA